MARPLVQIKGMHKIFNADENGFPITSDFKESFIQQYGTQVNKNTLIWIDCDAEDTRIFHSMYSEGYTYTYAHGTLYNASGRTKWFNRISNIFRLDMSLLNGTDVLA